MRISTPPATWPSWRSRRSPICPGATLPLEAHGYRARESVGHTLWEMTRWLDLNLKAAPAAE
ncbi:MAG: hypothetical protein K5831_06760 [Brevundimonas sp.]|uniref:hypothetical protein n=1 Tax=Brevundimonas sp. TaxID=1871086 RepID=UPI00258F6470|nr:hypothetical protein [Brevundimonas sp.]MCV0414568.1 hypothetical protein [Brevundimonas sp.]